MNTDGLVNALTLGNGAKYHILLFGWLSDYVMFVYIFSTASSSADDRPSTSSHAAQIAGLNQGGSRDGLGPGQAQLPAQAQDRAAASANSAASSSSSNGSGPNSMLSVHYTFIDVEHRYGLSQVKTESL